MTEPGDPDQDDPNAPGRHQPPEEPGFAPPDFSKPTPPEQPAQPPSPGYQQPAPQFPPPAGQFPPPMPPPPAGYGYGAGAVVPAGMYYDAASGLTLPNGTALASVGRRIGAYFLSIVLVIVTLVIGYVVWGLMAWRKGTTPALQVLGMRVWRPADNRPASFGIMALREIVGRICDGILSALTEIVSFVMFVATKEHRSLHDLVAGTVVLHDPDKVLP